MQQKKTLTPSHFLSAASLRLKECLRNDITTRGREWGAAANMAELPRLCLLLLFAGRPPGQCEYESVVMLVVCWHFLLTHAKGSFISIYSLVLPLISASMHFKHLICPSRTKEYISICIYLHDKLLKMYHL